MTNKLTAMVLMEDWNVVTKVQFPNSEKGWKFFEKECKEYEYKVIRVTGQNFIIDNTDEFADDVLDQCAKLN